MTIEHAPAGTIVAIDIVINVGYEPLVPLPFVVIDTYPAVEQGDGTVKTENTRLSRARVTAPWCFGDQGAAQRFTANDDEDYDYCLTPSVLHAISAALASVADSRPELAHLIRYPVNQFLAPTIN